MASFTGDYLSKIIARQIIEPQDRSQYLPFATPIYCPDYNGVRADAVEIINPNSSTYYPTSDGKNIYIGVDPAGKAKMAFNNMIIGDPTISTSITGVITASGFDSENAVNVPYNKKTAPGKYKFTFEVGDITTDQYIVTSEGFPTFLKLEVTADTDTDSDTDTDTDVDEESTVTVSLVIPAIDNEDTDITLYDEVQEDTKYIVEFDVAADKFTATIYDADGNELNSEEKEIDDDRYDMATPITFGVLASDSTSYPGESVTVYLSESEVNGVVLATVDSTSSSIPRNVKNTISVNINKKFVANYVLPHEVNLESNFDMMDVIKADMAARFKQAVSAEIADQIEGLSEGEYQSVEEGDTQAETIGKLIANFIANGTGQKFSIVRYSNGAPVAVMRNSNQPNIAKEIKDRPEGEFEYGLIDDINVPSMNYIERPTLLLSNTNFISYCQNLVARQVDTYVEDKLIVDTAYDYEDKGICGSNDVFAVAFTAPKIVKSSCTDIFADNVTIEVDYGVKLVNPKNLFLVF